MTAAKESVSPEPENNLRLEIGHVLFIDLVGYSKLLIEEQKERLSQLTEIVLATAQVREAPDEQLVRLPTGDGMALVFRNSSEEPARCALAIAQALEAHPEIAVRMGVHSGPVSEVTDVSGRTNIAGAGINMAQRVMDCGDAGHILLSQRVAEDLASYRDWKPHLQDLGEVEVKHGQKIGIVNLSTGELGNSALPGKWAEGKETGAAHARRRRNFAWFAAILCLTIALGIAWAIFSRQAPQPAGTPSEKRIAVLPFKPLVSGNDDQVMELGMADSLITKLSNSRELIISSLPSVRKYSGLEQNSLAAGRELQVDSVLEGNLQKVGDQIRVTARLIRVRDGASLWAATFNEKFTDVFAVQDTISQKVADALALQLSGEEKKQLTKRYTDNLEAYQLYLTGRYHWNLLTPPEITKSIGYFEQAIALDKNYALAYFGLAEAYRALTINGDLPTMDLSPKAAAAARKAIEIDPALAEPHVTLAFIHMWFDWDWAGAEAEAQRALTLNPNLAFAHIAHAQLLTALGRHPEAIAEATRARQLDPVSPIINTLEGLSFFYANRYEEATAHLQKALDLNPRFWVAWFFRGKVQLAEGDYPGAGAAFSKAREFSGNGSQPVALLAYSAARAGDPGKARALLAELQATGNARYLPPYSVAEIYLGLDERDNCFTWLEKACAEHDVRLFLLGVDQIWDPLRSDPRFVSIMQRLALP